MMLWLVVLALVLALVLFVQLKPARVAAFALGLERRKSGLRLGKQAVQGFNMPYLEGGRGEVLMLIHGFGGDKDNFTRMAGHLTPHYRVIIPDLPGFGDASRDPNASYCMASQVERVRAFAKALGIQRMILGGNSMGGFIATQYAAEHPDEVSALWLLDPAGTASAHDTPMMHHYEATGELPLLLRSEADGQGLIDATMHRPPYFPGFIKKVLTRRGLADYRLHCQIMCDLKQHSPLLEAQFERVKTPALIVWGERDQVLNPKGAQAMQALLPNGQSRLMPGIGHLPMLEAPRRSARDFMSWIAERQPLAF